MGAIWDGKMVVHVSDQETGRRQTADASSLESPLKPIAGQQRSRPAGWLPGQQAVRAWETLQSGDTLDAKIDRSISIKFRRLPPAACRQAPAAALVCKSSETACGSRMTHQS